MTSRIQPDASDLDISGTGTDLAAGTPSSVGYRGSRNEQRQALYLEFTPLIRRLMHRYGSTEALRQEMAFTLYCRFWILIDRYDPAAGTPLRTYLARHLSAAAQDLAHSRWRLQTQDGDWISYE